MTCRIMLSVLLLSAGVMFAQAGTGLKPRAQLSDYPVFQKTTEVGVGADRLSRKQVKNTFATDLQKRYVVVEVGLFPGTSATTVVPDDFVLRVKEGKSLVRAARPEEIAAALQKRPEPATDVTLHPSVGVGYETAHSDEMGNQVPGTWTKSVGVNVGTQKKKPANTNADRRTMETELRDKSLPEGKLGQAIAGYLYFPSPTDKSVEYQLEYRHGDQVLTVNLPATRD